MIAVTQFTSERIDINVLRQAAEKLLGRSLKISDDLIKRHYHNRGILPLEITQNLNEKEADDLRPRPERHRSATMISQSSKISSPWKASSASTILKPL